MRSEETGTSPSSLQSQATKLAYWLEHLFERVGRSAQEHSWIWVAALTLLYVACTVAHSFAKPLWFDELFTFYISRTHGWRERLALGLAEGTCPPAFYGLTHACLRLFGGNSLAARMPEIIGFWLMCICLFLFVRRRCAAIFAFLAMLIPVGTLAYSYADEARPYGLILGMAGLSLYSWQSIVEGRRRALALIFLTVSVASGVSSHFYGAQIVLPLFAGEACRTLERRKIDWGILCAIVLGLAPLAVLVPLAQKAFAANYRSARSPAVYWAEPHVNGFVGFYSALFEPMLPVLVTSILVTAVVYGLGGRGSHREESSEQRFPLPELAAAIMYLFVPAVMLLLTWRTTGYYNHRYALSATLGCVILFVYLSSMLSPNRLAIPCLIMVVLLGHWVGVSARSVRRMPGPADNLSVGSPLYPKGDALPIVMPDCIWFLQMAHYSTREVTSRLTFLTDVPHATRRPDLDGEMSLAVCRHVLPGTIEDYHAFLSRHREIWMLSHGDPTLEWLPSQLRDEGWKLQYEAQTGNDILFRASR